MSTEETDDHTHAHVREARVTGHAAIVEIEGIAIIIGTAIIVAETAIADRLQISIETEKFDDTYPNKLEKEAF